MFNQINESTEELTMKPPKEQELESFLRVYPEMSRADAFFAMSVINGCRSLGYCDIAEEEALETSGIELMQELGFTPIIASTIQKKWKSVIDGQPELPLVDKGAVEQSEVDQVINTWRVCELPNPPSHTAAKDICRIMGGCFSGIGFIDDYDKVLDFYITSLNIFHEKGVNIPSALYVQKKWRKIVEEYKHCSHQDQD